MHRNSKMAMTTKHYLLLVGVAGVVGGLFGGVAGGLTAQQMTPITVTPIPTTTSTIPVTPIVTSTVPVISLVPVERRAANPLLPPAFTKRRSAGVGVLYRKPKGTALTDRLLGSDRFLANAVSLTSDGWFVTPATTFDGIHLADVVLWHDGATFAADRGVLDRLSNLAFFHVAATSLPAPAFTQSRDVSVGAEVWSEPQPNGFSPGVVLDIGGRTAPNDAASSEVVTRRIVLDALATSSDRGGAVWDPNGSLVGIVENQKAGDRIHVIPASEIATALSSILSNGEIRRAQLGVSALDLGVARFDGAREALPMQGALVQDVKKDSPALKAKIKVGDVIVQVERDILDGTVDLGEVLTDYHMNTGVTFVVHRGTADVSVPVTLGSMVTSEIIK
jgi:S1-C subfamily serine protease